MGSHCHRRITTISQPPSLLPPYDISASVDRLPDTVLSDVFLIVKSASTVWDHQRRTPFALACVSRRWRIVALSTPVIWDYVASLLPAERVTAYILRSRQVPITLWFNILHAEMNTAVIEDVFRRLGNDVWTRIRDLIVILDYERLQLSRLVLDTLNTVFDAGHPGVFRRIIIDVTTDSWGGHTIEPINELCLRLPNCQTLRSLSLAQADLSLENLAQVSSLPLLWELELERIRVGFSNLLLPLLSATPNLVNLSFKACEFGVGSTNLVLGPHTWFQLAKLENLTLDKVEGLYFLNILFIIFDMPKLRTLKFGTASSTSLGNLFVPRVNWSALFRNTNIEKLALGDFSSEVIQELIIYIDKLVDLKELQILPDGPFESVDFPFEFVGKLLETECCPMLQKLVLNDSWRPDAQTWTRLEDLKRERPSLIIYAGGKKVECPEEGSAESSTEEGNCLVEHGMNKEERKGEVGGEEELEEGEGHEESG